MTYSFTIKDHLFPKEDLKMFQSQMNQGSLMENEPY